VAQVREIVSETLHELIEPLVYEEALDLFAVHRAAGREVVIVSSSGDEIVGPIGEMLGVDRVIATRMVVADGKYTGEIAFYAYGQNKATAIAELAQEQGWDLADCYAYSDSATDAPMLEVVGHPVAVNPDRALRKEALERDWPVRSFARPVRAQRRIPTPPGPGEAWAAALVVGMVGAVLWVALRRPRTV
jgi:phosphoserine phosphatase